MTVYIFFQAPKASSQFFCTIYRNLIKFMKARGKIIFFHLMWKWHHGNVWLWHIILSTLHSFMISIDPNQRIMYRWFRIYRGTWRAPFFQFISVSIGWQIIIGKLVHENSIFFIFLWIKFYRQTLNYCHKNNMACK